MLARAFAPRRPTETVLFGVVREHLEAFLRHAEETYAAPLPRYVENELRGYLRCGVFSHGFVRARCDACGHDLLVAFSCKARGACPSCAGRRMSDTAAHLVDRVFPSVPVRQWVLSLPFAVRRLAAFDARALGAFLRIFVNAIFARARRRASQMGLEGVQPGAVTFIQRFGSSLNLNVHFHVVVADGVFEKTEDGLVVFHEGESPDRAELEAIVRTVHERIARWVTRRAVADDDADAREERALEACARLASHAGRLESLRLRDETVGESEEQEAVPIAERDSVELDGFNLHASVVIDADDDLGRERLFRYGARPAFSLERMTRLPKGRIGYRVKKMRDGRAKTRVMTPLELLVRLAALVPPPRYPLIRYHGVFAPRARWRSAIVPKPRARSDCARPKVDVDETRKAEKARGRRGSESALVANRPAAAPRVESPVRSALPKGTRWAVPVRVLAPNVLSVSHWERIEQGALLADAGPIDWARLLQRTFAIDVQSCGACGGRLRIVRSYRGDDAIALLGAPGLPCEPDMPRARDPTALDDDDDDE